MTSAHISENLPRLLTGDANRDEVMAAAEHLRNCPDCQQELISAVVAHASLTSAHRFAPEIVAPASTSDDEGEVHVDQSEDAPLPDMSAMFAKVRAEASVAPAKPQHRRRLLAVAAAAAVLVGGGVTLAETVGSSSSTTSGQSVALKPFGVGTRAAEVTISGNGRMRIDATALPRPSSGQTYEVWLSDATRNRMQSVGFIGSDNQAELTVSPNVMAQYTAIEVSRQRVDQTVTYSNISVLRGTYR
jgi:hypothetical protein